MLSHRFICLFATCIGSLMGCQDLHSIFDQAGFCFSLLSFKTSLYVLHKPFIKCVFFSWSGCLLFLLTLSFPENQFLIQWSLVYQVFLSQITSLVLYGKIYYRIQGHLGFLLWSSRSFTVFYFTFRATISLTFVKGISVCLGHFFVLGSFAYRCSFVPHHWKTISASLYCLCYSVKDQLNTFMWVYSKTFYSFPLFV